MHPPIGLDFWSIVGVIYVTTSVSATIGSIIAMLYGVRSWIDKKASMRADKAAKERDSMKFELLLRLSKQDAILSALQNDLNDLKKKEN